MKKYPILRLMLALVLALVWTPMSTLNAQQPPHHGAIGHVATTSLVVTSDYYAFWLFLDDVLQNEQSVRSIQLDYVPEGDHYLRVELDDPDHRTVGQLVRIDFTHRNFRIERSRHLLGLSPGYGMTHPELVMALLSVQTNQPHGRMPGQNAWFGYHRPAAQPNTAMTPPPPSAGPMAMSEADFSVALGIVQRESFESTKLSAAKQIASRNLLTAHQIERLCRCFEFDNTKLDFAKFAYDRCVDPERYYLLHDVFTFDSNKKSLDKFLEQKR